MNAHKRENDLKYIITSSCNNAQNHKNKAKRPSLLAYFPFYQKIRKHHIGKTHHVHKVLSADTYLKSVYTGEKNEVVGQDRGLLL